ncbi:MAG: magnesium transporter [Bacteroidetes bacterium]|nr:magnesium transporter [Bacteroidota bacterium]
MEVLSNIPPEERDRLGGVLEVDAQLVEDISDLIDTDQVGMVLNILTDLHPADLASIVTHLSKEEAQKVLLWLPVETAADILAELDDDYRANLLDTISPVRLAAMIDELYTDDAADVLADLPDDVAQQILPELEDHIDVKELLSHDEDTAGGLMATEYIAVGVDFTVADATEEVRRNADQMEDLFVLFVVDELDRLVGIVDMKSLLLSPSKKLIRDIMTSDVKSVTTDVDQEDVARLMERYDLVTLAVTDAEGCLVGRITIDDVVDVIREEAEEDYQRMSGVAGGEEHTDSVLQIVRGRLPWLMVGLAGATMAAIVILLFEESLASAAILASFIPIVMATAGNAGIQSSAIAVQGLASGDIWATDIWKRLTKEVLVALVNGTVAATMLGIAIIIYGTFSGMRGPIELAYTASLALMFVIVVATTLGATIPLLLDKVGIDPALATGPFITTSNDILGILIFFLLANWLYL